MVEEIGYGTMLDVILTIYTSFVNMVSYLIILPFESAKFSAFQFTSDYFPLIFRAIVMRITRCTTKHYRFGS